MRKKNGCTLYRIILFPSTETFGRNPWTRFIHTHGFRQQIYQTLIMQWYSDVFTSYSPNALTFFFAVWNCDLLLQAKSEYEYGAKTQINGNWVGWVCMGPDSVKREHDMILIGHAYFRVMRYATCRSTEYY